MRAHIERAKAVNDQINAIVKDRYAEALKEAMDLDVLLDQNPDAEKYSEANQPFLGVPLSVKEAFSVKGNKIDFFSSFGKSIQNSSV